MNKNILCEEAKMEFIKIAMSPHQHKECKAKCRKVATYKE